jgi:ADP-ribosyl-[dinitrogen reductase] hydrolase
MAGEKYLIAFGVNKKESFSDVFPTLASVKYRFSKTHSGYSFDIAKSALQKYIRRGEVNDAIFFAIECLLFYHIGGGQANYTNSVNRLRVISLEDIGLADPYLIVFVDKCICGYPISREKTLIKKKIKEDTFGLWESPGVIPNLIAEMCSTLKYRFCSHTKFLQYEQKSDLKTLETILKSPNDKTWNNAAPIVFNLFQSGEGSKILDLVEECSQGKSHEKEIKDIVFVCRKWISVMTVKETYLACDHAVFSFLYRDSLIWKSNRRIRFAHDQKSLEYFKKNFDREMNGDPRDYINDKHTSEGRSEKTSNFAVEGSLVAYEDETLVARVKGEELKNTYIRERLKEDNILKETKLFKFKIRAQLTCSKCRPDVYFADINNTQGVVVKGPFIEFNDIYESYNLFRVMELFNLEGERRVNFPSYVTVKVAYPDMFLIKSSRPEVALRYDIPFGERLKANVKTPAYFLVMEDLFGIKNYPSIMKSGTKWPETKVVDYTKVKLSDTNGDSVREVGFPSEESMKNEKRCISFIHQLIFRCILQLGDFALRNFIYRGNEVWNIDCDSVTKNKMEIRWSAKMKKIVTDTFVKNRSDILWPWKYYLIQKDLWIKLERTLGISHPKKNLIDVIKGEYELFPSPHEKAREIQSLIIKIVSRCKNATIDEYNFVKYANDEEFFLLLKEMYTEKRVDDLKEKNPLSTIKGMLMGVLLGDALGAPHEMKASKTIYTGKLEFTWTTGRFRKPHAVGQFSDDSEMTLALARNIIDNKGEVDRKSLIVEYVTWAQSLPDMGYHSRGLFQCTKAKGDEKKIAAYEKRYNEGYLDRNKERVFDTKKSKKDMQSNGALMRSTPLALFPDKFLVDVNISNPSTVCVDSERIYLKVLSGIINGIDVVILEKDAETTEIKDCIRDVENKKERDLTKNKGWVIHCLYVALWVAKYMKNSSFKECMDWVIGKHPGGDVDTLGAVAGGIAGARIGYDEMNKEKITRENIQQIYSWCSVDTTRPNRYKIKNEQELVDISSALLKMIKRN